MQFSDGSGPGFFQSASQPGHGIYIHIPFCLKKCAYCDFYSITDLKLRGNPFVTALLQEMARVAPQVGPSDTLYFGGVDPFCAFAAAGREPHAAGPRPVLLSKPTLKSPWK